MCRIFEIPSDDDERNADSEDSGHDDDGATGDDSDGRMPGSVEASLGFDAL